MNLFSSKVWGSTRELIHTEHYSKYELQLKNSTFCSLHYHLSRANKFHVIAGKVEIIEMYGPKIVKTMLCPGDSHNVHSLVPHLFLVHIDGFMVEEYYPDRGGVVDKNDIVRIYEGGTINSNLDSKLSNILF